jgi:NAD(P)-dependent dehydrogenase (short-subunit alcohol dehydrogenase family)
MHGKTILITGGLKGIGLAADLTSAAEAAAMLEAVEQKLGPLDVLVSSAGASRSSPPDELTPDFYRAAMCRAARYHECESAWNENAYMGVIGVQ